MAICSKIIERKPPKSTMHTGKTICFYQHAWSYCWIVVISTKFLKLYHATKFWFIVLKKNYHYVPVYTKHYYNTNIFQEHIIFRNEEELLMVHLQWKKFTMKSIDVLNLVYMFANVNSTNQIWTYKYFLMKHNREISCCLQRYLFYELS